MKWLFFDMKRPDGKRLDLFVMGFLTWYDASIHLLRKI